MTPDFTFIFLSFFSLTLLVRLWLKWRHIRFVASHRSAVPANFAERIPLPDHQKAADYTVDRSKMAIVDILIEAALLLAFTLGGGLTALHNFWSTHVDGLPYGVAMIFSVLAISSLIDLPITLYKQFVIEARHGFNRMTLGLFFSDLIKQTLLGLAIGAPVILAVLWLMGTMGQQILTARRW